jgi:hypothetical protein
MNGIVHGCNGHPAMNLPDLVTRLILRFVNESSRSTWLLRYLIVFVSCSFYLTFSVVLQVLSFSLLSLKRVGAGLAQAV